MRMLHTMLTLVCAAPLLVAGEASQDPLSADLKKQEAALAELNAKIQGVRDTLAKDETLTPLLKAAQDSEAALRKAMQEDAGVIAARKAESEAQQQYMKTLDQAVAQDANGKVLLGKSSQLDDDSWELEIKRRLAQLEMDQAVRPRIERTDTEVVAAGQKFNAVRGQYDQRDRNVAEFQAARQRIDAAQRTFNDLLAAPALVAARQAVQEANACYEQLRKDHALTKAFQEAEQQYRTLVADKTAASDRGKTLAGTINEAGVSLKANQTARETTRQDINTVRRKMEQENQEVLAAAKVREETTQKRQAAERNEAFSKFTQARDTAFKAYREALSKAEAEKGLPDLMKTMAEIKASAAKAK